ncbi:MAG: NlpC/P60 family protein [Candidatus Limivivens sp.]|nr:NlpC/P60 family protein [Candidatus Limivivens sp.]
MKKYLSAVLKCLLLCAILILPSSAAEAAVKYQQKYAVPFESGIWYAGYEYVPELDGNAKIKKVVWKSGNSAKTTIYTGSEQSLYAAILFKTTGTTKVYRTVTLKSGKVIKTTYIFQVYKKNTWFKNGGYTYYYLPNGDYAVDKWIGDKYVDSYGHLNARFEKISSGVRYRKEDGTYAKNEWVTASDGSEYFFDRKGLMVKNKWVDGCYLQKDGKKKEGLVKKSNGWKMVRYTWYGEDEYVTNRWETVNGSKVYFDSKGNQVKNQWKKIDGKTYHFNKSGYLDTSKWINGYYVNADGYRITSQRVGDFYVNSKGQRVAGKWIGGYYVDEDGKIVKNQWLNGVYVGLNGKKIKNMRYTSGTVAVNGACLLATKSKLKQLVSVGKKEVGKPYIWGGNGPDGYDCSGFVSYCYRSIGITLPRTTYYMYDSGVDIDPHDVSEWQIGDLLINQGTADGGGGGHVIMYIGKGKVIQSTSGGVQVGNAYDFVGRYARVKRILYVK